MSARLCSRPGCGEFGPHRHGEDRRSAAKRGYDRTWQRLRLMQLRREPLCREHQLRRGEIMEATEVDHIVPLSAGGANALENLQSLCKSCHSAKTAREAGQRVS